MFDNAENKKNGGSWMVARVVMILDLRKQLLIEIKAFFYLLDKRRNPAWLFQNSKPNLRISHCVYNYQLW